MGLKIVTGRTGYPHVTSNQIQAFNRSLLGDLAILDVGQHFDAVVRDANTIRIYDGCIVVQGIYAIIPHDEYEDVLISPVSVGNTRIDTIYLHYTKDMESDTESVELDIAQGEEAVNNPVKPDIDAGGDTWEGTTDIRIPLYDVTVTSFETTITAYEYMDVYSPNISDLNQRIPKTTVSGVKGDAESEYRSGNVNITPTNIGLGNVDNTADTNKPVSNATQTALNLKADLTYVDAKIAAAYHAGGSKTVAELVSALLIADNMGKVYNMSDSGVTTADFVEGAGDTINEGDNVGICNVGTEESPIYKFDLLSGFVDLSAYATTSAVNAGLAEKVDKVTGKGLSTNDYTNEEKQKLANIESNAQANVQSDWNEDDTEDDGYIKNKPNLSTSLSATGNPLTIESSESNLVECVAKVEAVQEGSGDPSPDNIRPITGQTEVVIEDCGKNLFDIDTVLFTFTKSDNKYIGTPSAVPLKCIEGVFKANTQYTMSFKGFNNTSTSSNFRFLFVYTDGTTTDIGYVSSQSELVISKASDANKTIAYISRTYGNNTSFTIYDIQLEEGSTVSSYEPYKGKTYRVEIGQKNKVEETLSGYTIASTGLITVDSNNTFDMQIAKIKKGVTYTITTDDIFCVGYFTEKPVDGSRSYDSQRHVDTNQRTFTAPITGYIAFRTNKGYTTPQCEQGSQATPFVPYNPNLPEAIYGGELDVLTGKMVVNKVKRQITSTIGTGWQAESGREHSFYVYDNVFVPSAFSSSTVKDDARFACDAFPTVTPISCYNGNLGVAKEGNRLRLGNPSWNAVSEVTSYLSNNEVYVVYELAEPYTIQLTPEQIRLLKGTNHLSCNTGDLSIKYYPDNVLGQLKGDIEKGLNAYYDYQIQALWDKINELQA